MAIGALYGRALGIAVEAGQRSYPHLLIFSSCEADTPCVTPGTYAIIGAASALGGVTRMTVSIVVIMFELTGALTYVLPIMVAVMLSKWVGDATGKLGIYESWIRFHEYPFLDNHTDDAAIPDLSAAEIMTPIDELVVLPATGHTIQSLGTLLATQPHRGFPVVADSRDPILLGYISRTELSFALGTAVSAPRNLSRAAPASFTAPAHLPVSVNDDDDDDDENDENDDHSDDHDEASIRLDLRPWMDQTPITLSSQTSLGLTVALFQKLGLRYVLFCDRGVLHGLLTKKDVWYMLNGAGERRTSLDHSHFFGASAGLPDERGGDERGLLDGDGR
ncbi:MAG: hypothetical protein M1826_005092 [Phylliscum demangeonii]|nr:MAG: hypothetical protein M1826_005092 [Phylliscum demangeonii]